jgi:hypothetical protein
MKTLIYYLGIWICVLAERLIKVGWILIRFSLLRKLNEKI